MPHIGHGPNHQVYNLTCAEFDQLVKRSEGRCDRCGVPYPKLVVDHDHALGRRAVRGLLCHSCNMFVAVTERVRRRGIPGHSDRYLDREPFHALIPAVRPPRVRQATVRRGRPPAGLPAPLWDRLGEVVGNGNRSLQIRDLVEAFLCALPMPVLPERDVSGAPVRPATPAELAEPPAGVGRRRSIRRPSI